MIWFSEILLFAPRAGKRRRKEDRSAQRLASAQHSHLDRSRLRVVLGRAIAVVGKTRIRMGELWCHGAARGVRACAVSAVDVDATQGVCVAAACVSPCVDLEVAVLVRGRPLEYRRFSRKKKTNVLLITCPKLV